MTDIACSIARSADIITERWMPLILRDLFVGMARFEDIRRDLGIASNVLADRLGRLEENGIVVRRQYQTKPVRHEYALTAKGRDLYPVIATLIAWGDKWLAGSAGPPSLVVHETCGRPTAAVTVCRECGGALDADNVHAARGPGGQEGIGTAIIGDYLVDEPQPNGHGIGRR